MGMKSPFPSKILNDSHDNDNHDMHPLIILFCASVFSQRILLSLLLKIAKTLRLGIKKMNFFCSALYFSYLWLCRRYSVSA